MPVVATRARSRFYEKFHVVDLRALAQPADQRLPVDRARRIARRNDAHQRRIARRARRVEGDTLRQRHRADVVHHRAHFARDVPHLDVRHPVALQQGGHLPDAAVLLLEQLPVALLQRRYVDTLLAPGLPHDKFRLRQSESGELVARVLDHLLAQGFAEQQQLDLRGLVPVRIVFAALDHPRLREVEDLGDVFVDRGLEDRNPHHAEADHDTRNEGRQRDNHHQALDVPLAGLVDEDLLLVLQEPHHEVGRKGDEDRVDEEEVEGPEEEAHLSRGQAETRRAEGRNQRRGDGYARDDGRGAVLARLRHDARQTAEQRDQHVVGRRNGARQQLAAVRRQRRKEKVDRRGDDRDDEHQHEVAQRLLQQVEVVDAQREPDSHDRAHDGRNEHRADDYGGGVDVQAQRGDHRGEDQHPEVHAPEDHALRDVGDDLVALRLVVLEAEAALQELAHVLDPGRKGGSQSLAVARGFVGFGICKVSHVFHSLRFILPS